MIAQSKFENNDNDKYPVMKMLDNNKYIVWFIGEGVGVVVWKSPDAPKCRFVGYYSEDWLEKDFIICDGKVILENE